MVNKCIRWSSRRSQWQLEILLRWTFGAFFSFRVVATIRTNNNICPDSSAQFQDVTLWSRYSDTCWVIRPRLVQGFTPTTFQVRASFPKPKTSTERPNRHVCSQENRRPKPDRVPGDLETLSGSEELPGLQTERIRCGSLRSSWELKNFLTQTQLSVLLLFFLSALFGQHK